MLKVFPKRPLSQQASANRCFSEGAAQLAFTQDLLFPILPPASCKHVRCPRTEHKHLGATSGCGWWPWPAASPQGSPVLCRGHNQLLSLGAQCTLTGCVCRSLVIILWHHRLLVGSQRARSRYQDFSKFTKMKLFCSFALGFVTSSCPSKQSLQEPLKD